MAKSIDKSANMCADDITFEGAQARLEEIVKILEGGGASLDESLKLYEEGIALVRICNEKLANAEMKIKMLHENKDGSVSESDFGDNND